MNRDHWKQMLPLITHFAEGGEVESDTGDEGSPEWTRLETASFSGDPERYRIKPTPRLVLRTSDDPELVWLKDSSSEAQIILAYQTTNYVETKGWEGYISYFHDEGYLCSATRNGPWLPLVKEEIV